MKVSKREIKHCVFLEDFLFKNLLQVVLICIKLSILGQFTSATVKDLWAAYENRPSSTSDSQGN